MRLPVEVAEEELNGFAGAEFDLALVELIVVGFDRQVRLGAAG